jgi:hypothetical protein
VVPGVAVKPSVGRVVHYVSYGTPGGEFGKECRAAIVTEVPAGVASPQTLGLCVLNPTGQFFNRSVPFNDGSGSPGDPDCPDRPHDGPHRYCACGWIEPSLLGGTWHWPERVE